MERHVSIITKLYITIFYEIRSYDYENVLRFSHGQDEHIDCKSISCDISYDEIAIS